MDLSAIIDEFNRRKAQAGQRISDMFMLPQKPANWFQQMQDVQRNAVTTPEQRANIHKELADIAERMTAGIVPEPIRARERAMQTDPSAAAKPFTSEEVKGMTPFVTAAAPIAYHGTPHTFDKFDASKIGTGQGAQSYGHGLYFAENPQVAKTYQSMHGGTSRPSLDVSQLGDIGWQGRLAQRAVMEQGDIPTAITALRAKAKESSYDLGQNWNKAADWLEQHKDVRLVPPSGSTYQVNIPDQHAARMLDWDKRLSEQPHLPKELVNEVTYQLQKPASEITGEKFYQILAARRGSYNQSTGGRIDPQAASKELAAAGIPGIKYLDQGSRTAGQGTRNFVVFDPAILEDVTRK